jgi:hypothetical protein
MRYHETKSELPKGRTNRMQELRDRLTALRDRIAHVMVRL